MILLRACSLLLYPSSEGISYILKCVLQIWKYISLGLQNFEVRAKEKNLFIIGPTAKVRELALFIKITKSAINWAKILLPKMVQSISFWEQCSRAPPLFAPLSLAVMFGHFWSVTGFGGPKQGYPPKKFQNFFLKSFVNGQIGKVKKFQQLTLSHQASIDVEKKCGSICPPPPV